MIDRPSDQFFFDTLCFCDIYYNSRFKGLLEQKNPSRHLFSRVDLRQRLRYIIHLTFLYSKPPRRS